MFSVCVFFDLNSYLRDKEMRVSLSPNKKCNASWCWYKHAALSTQINVDNKMQKAWKARLCWQGQWHIICNTSDPSPGTLFLSLSGIPFHCSLLSQTPFHCSLLSQTPFHCSLLSQTPFTLFFKSKLKSISSAYQFVNSFYCFSTNPSLVINTCICSVCVCVCVCGGGDECMHL